jgi:hypothetical protein
MRLKWSIAALLVVLVGFGRLVLSASAPLSPATNGHSSGGEERNLIVNSTFADRTGDSRWPAHYQLAGNVEYRYLGDPRRDTASWGVAMQSGAGDPYSGSVAQMVTDLKKAGSRSFRFSFRGLPQAGFSVNGDNLFIKAEFFGEDGTTSYDGKVKRLYSAVEQDRRDLSVNGDRRVGGAATWRTYQLDFVLPFAQVDQVRLTVGFDHGNAGRGNNTEFYVTDFRLVATQELVTKSLESASTRPIDNVSVDNLIHLGGRWYYLPKGDETQAPKLFTAENVDRLLYHDDRWSAPFEGNMTAWLKAGDKDTQGNVVKEDRFLADNVTVEFDETTLIMHTKGIPNHPTAKFPGNQLPSNPNSIQEQRYTFYLPLDPKVNARHIVTAKDNSNHALPMGPIGVALNGVVFFNPFDANSTDASNMMDNCCGHPNFDGLYHYHKYPICVNSPWADEGQGHSPLIGFAFDGFPLYGPYEKAGVMAKDVRGEQALNNFNMHFDAQRGWHYHVTPGQFPYLIGGYWGTEDSRDSQRPHHGMGSNGPGGGMGRGGSGGGPGGFGGQGGNGPQGRGGFGGGRPPPPDGNGPPGN